MTYCTIITGSYGYPHRLYKSARGALRAAERYCRLHHRAVEVAWCKEPDIPKVWLAYVRFVNGAVVTQHTEHWAAEAERGNDG